MGKYRGNYLTPAKYRDAYIAADQKVRRLKSRVEGLRSKLMIVDYDEQPEVEAELNKAMEDFQAAKKEADRLHCLWTTGKEPGAAARGIVWRNSLGGDRP